MAALTPATLPLAAGLLLPILLLTRLLVAWLLLAVRLRLLAVVEPGLLLVARLLVTRPGLLALLLIGQLVHTLLQFVHVREDILLFLGEAFKLLADVRALLIRAGLLQGGLQFAHALIQILLALGKFLEPVGDLQLLLLLRGPGAVLVRVCLALVLVLVVLLREVELVQLRLHPLAAALLLLAALAALPAGHLELARRQLEHGLIGRLLRRQRRGQGSERIFVRGLAKLVRRGGHRLLGGVNIGRKRLVVVLLLQIAHPVQRILLGALHHLPRRPCIWPRASPRSPAAAN